MSERQGGTSWLSVVPPQQPCTIAGASAVQQSFGPLWIRFEPKLTLQRHEKIFSTLSLVQGMAFVSAPI
jgi:hypothetical protein